MSRSWRALSCAWLAGCAAVLAQAAPAPYVPSELEPWRAWVLHGEEFRDCPFIFDQAPAERAAYRCAWPGVLRLEVSANGAHFAQSWQVYAAGFAPLPGDEQSWPQEVTEGGKTLPVSLRADHPGVYLEPGRHQLSGRFAWQRTPGTLRLAPRTAELELTIAGVAVAWPQRTGDTVWIGEGREQGPALEADALRLQVYRLLRDGIPLTMTARVQLEVAGASREVLLARAVPAGFEAMQLTSPLPARIETDGRLRVQLRPGSWQIELRARADALPDGVALDPGEGDWAAEEIWSYESADALRVTLPEGANPVDPAQVGAPPEWHGFPAFRLARGDALRIVERSRGVPAALENQLTLARVLWRDYAGRAYTVQDTITGRMETGWRLDMSAPYRLGSAQANGRDLLVTQGESADLAGVEVRDGELYLNALGRLERRGGALPATGWQQRFESASVTLHLPEGQRLLAAPGVDYAGNTWLQNWRLLDFFLVLFIALAVGRLVSAAYGGAALAMLVLTFQEPGAPVWIWLALLLAVALVRFAPEGRLLRAARALRLLAFLMLGLVAVPFVASQLRAALYPQLDASASQYWAQTMAVRAPPPVAAPEEIMLTAERVAESAKDTAMAMTIAPMSGGIAAAARQRLDYAPSVLVQSGPAVPGWNGVVYELGWSGPVSADDDLRLVILGSLAYRGVRVLGVLLIGLLAFALARASFGGLSWPPRLGLRAGAPALLAALAAALVATPDARADTPDPALLGELRQRLLEAPDCVPRCAELARAHARVDADTLTLELHVEAHARVAFPLPGALRAWEPNSVIVDGLVRDWLYRGEDERLLLVVEPGAHTVELRGPLPPLASLRIPFPEAPRYLEVEARGWSVSGVSDGRLASGALELERMARESSPDRREQEPLVGGAIAPFVRVTRVVQLAVDWSVASRVERLAPADGAFTAEIPLLAGESVTSDVPVREGRVLASFAPGQYAFGWSSTLAQSERLSLTAGAGASAVEAWQVDVGPAWRVAHEGTPLIASGQQTWMPEFHPRPGESLTLDVSRPKALAGPTLTLDSALVRTTAGQRVVDSVLDLRYRSTRGGQHTLRLPVDARVVAITSDGEPLSVRPRDGELTLPIRPGEHHVSLSFQEERESTVLARTSAVDLGQESGNVSLALAFGSERWVLFTRGPWNGPAVLLWGELLVFLLLAPLLARLPGMPLRTYQWVLLGVGFSTFAWSVLALLALWFLAFAWRERSALPALRWRYNAMQIGLALLTLVTLAALLSTILWGALLGQPDMHIAGNDSSVSELRWFVDRSSGALPQGSALSLPRWVYQAAILSWALWLSLALLQWLPWAWRAWGRDGIWRGRAVRAAPDAT